MEKAHRAETGEQLHVYYNGTDITERCNQADDLLGYAMVFCNDPLHHNPLVTTGKHHAHPDDYKIICRHRLQGQITIKPGVLYAPR